MKPTARRKYRERVVIATVALSALPMIFAGSSAFAEPDPTDAPSTSASPDPSAAPDAPSDGPSQDQWQALDKIAAEHSALGVSGLTDTVLTLPAGTSDDDVAKVQAEIPAGMAVTVKVSKFAAGEADDVKNSVINGDWNKTGEDVGLVAAYDGDKDVVDVAVEGPQSTAEDLQQQYGDKVEVSPGRTTPQWGRFDDSVPFWGGGSIKNAATGSYCTAGYAVWDKAPTSPRW